MVGVRVHAHVRVHARDAHHREYPVLVERPKYSVARLCALQWLFNNTGPFQLSHDKGGILSCLRTRRRPHQRQPGGQSDDDS